MFFYLDTHLYIFHIFLKNGTSIDLLVSFFYLYIMNKKEYIAANFDIEGLRELGFLTTEKTTEEIDKRICKFFGLKNIFMYDYIMKGRVIPVKADLSTFSTN